MLGGMQDYALRVPLRMTMPRASMAGARSSAAEPTGTRRVPTGPASRTTRADWRRRWNGSASAPATG